MRTAAIALLAALVALPALAEDRGSRPTEALSKIEARRLPPAVVRQRITDQLGDILILPPQRSSPGKPTQPLRQQWYATVPRATAVSGVCQSDIVTFLFEPTDPNAGLQPGDMPAAVNGIQVQTGFRALRPAAAPAEGNPDYARDKVDCAGLSEQAERLAFTTAVNVETYVAAVRALALAQARAGTPGGPALDCRLINPSGPPDCRNALSALNPASVRFIAPCTPRPTPGVLAPTCLRLDAVTLVVEITRDSAGRLTFVDVAEELVIADAMRD